MVKDYLEGRHAEALKTQLRYLDLINGLFMEVNPIPVKTALNLMGLDAGPLRLPLCDLTEDQRNRLHRVLCQYNLIKKP